MNDYRKEMMIMPLKVWEINPVIWGNENYSILSLYQGKKKIHILVDDATAKKINDFVKESYYEEPYPPNIERND